MTFQKPLTTTTKSDKVDTMKKLYKSLMNYYSRWNEDHGIWIDESFFDGKSYVVIDLIERYEAGEKLNEVEIAILKETLEILDNHYSDILDEPIIEWE